LLHSVNPDGIATNYCLGPSNRIKALDGRTDQPYELVLQDCPHVPKRSENIFVHPQEQPSRSTTSTSIDAVHKPAGTKPEQPIETNARHMQFLVQGDGRVQSLAPVFDDIKDPGEDMVAEKPFCITTMRWGDDEVDKPYLVPCHRENVKPQEAFDSLETINLMNKVKPQQQVFDTERGSSFDSFLLDLNSKDTSFVQFAYQIGFSSYSSSSLSDKNNYEDFETIVVRVMTEDPGDGGESELVSDNIISSVWANNERQSGIVSYKLSSFSKSGKMEAHLMGQSRGGLETTWLASSTFEVPKKQDIFPNSWTWSALVFIGIMFCYLVFVKTTSHFCPTRSERKRMRTRNSELTTSTNNNSELLDGGIIPIDVSLPNRISEEEGTENMESDAIRRSFRENRSSVYDRTTATVTTATDLDSTIPSREENDEEGQQDVHR